MIFETMLADSHLMYNTSILKNNNLNKENEMAKWMMMGLVVISLFCIGGCIMIG